MEFGQEEVDVSVDNGGRIAVLAKIINEIFYLGVNGYPRRAGDIGSVEEREYDVEFV